MPHNILQLLAAKRNTTFNISVIKECRSIVRDESSVYFNVTAKHV